MMFKSIAFFGLFLAGVSAAPTPTEDLVPRACSTLGPSMIDVLRVSTPDNPSTGLQFTLSRAGSPVYNTQVAALTFEYIPTGATGCRLEIEIPPLAQVNQIAQGATQVDIWTTDPWNWNNQPTWNHPPTKRSMVATYAFPTQQTTTTSNTVLASNTCDNIMSFQVELSGWQNQEGSVNFFNTLGGKVGLVPIGFRMVYNC